MVLLELIIIRTRLFHAHAAAKTSGWKPQKMFYDRWWGIPHHNITISRGEECILKHSRPRCFLYCPHALRLLVRLTLLILYPVLRMFASVLVHVTRPLLIGNEVLVALRVNGYRKEYNTYIYKKSFGPCCSLTGNFWSILKDNWSL